MSKTVPLASRESDNIDRRERLRQIALETIDLAKVIETHLILTHFRIHTL
jgi:hypothetical protein